MDLQVMIPKATEVGQIQHKLNHQADVQQVFVANSLQADADLKQKQVRKREQMADGTIDDKTKRQQQQAHDKQQQSPAENDESDDNIAVDSIRGHIIDIKL